jgi:hypothetical protein
LPNTRLQPTWPRLCERTLDCNFRIPAKMVIELRKMAKRLSRQPLGGILGSYEMIYSYIAKHCVNCKRTLYLKILTIYKFVRVNSGLGPNYIICSSCKARNPTGNKEWVQMSLFGKIWYLILSIAYGLMIGLLTSSFINVAVKRLFNFDLPMEMIILICTILIFGIQLFRIILSLDRTEKSMETEKEVGYWNWETNLQFYGMIWIFLIVIGGAPFLFIK